MAQREPTAQGDLADDGLERVRAICLAFPEVTERLSHGSPAWFVRDRKAFVYFWADGHHQHEFAHLWCAAPPGMQDEFVENEPEVFFRPPYVGHRGWLGVRMDRRLPWENVEALCREAYRTVAPVTLVRQFDAGA
jgi:hypothetical protein